MFYSGDWVNGRRTGRGRMVYTTGEEYTGEWRDNLQVYIFLQNLFLRNC